MIRGSILILALASLVAMNGCTKCGGNAEQAPADTAAPAPEATPDAMAAPADGAAAPAEGAAPADPNAAPAADGAAASPTPGM